LLTRLKILGGIADTTAQTITAVRERAVRKPGGPTSDDVLAREIHELDRKVDWPPGGLIPASEKLPPPFDFERLVRFMAYPFIMTPVQHRWFKFLSTSFPMKAGGAAMGPALKRTAFDQLLFAPLGTNTASNVGIMNFSLTLKQVWGHSSHL